MINSAGLKTHPVITSSLERCKLLSPLQTTENPAHQRALQTDRLSSLEQWRWHLKAPWPSNFLTKSSTGLPNAVWTQGLWIKAMPRIFFNHCTISKTRHVCRIWQAAHYSLGLVTKIHRFRHTNTLDFLLHFCNLHFQEHLPWLPHWGSKYPGFLHNNTVHFESHELLRKENLHHSRVLRFLRPTIWSM